MNNDFGSCPGQRCCVFPENDSDHSGWDNSYTSVELSITCGGGYFWWMGWRHTYPDDPVQRHQYMSDDVVNQIGGRAHLEIVSNPDFEPSGPRYFGSDVVAWTHVARPVAPPPLQWVTPMSVAAAPPMPNQTQVTPVPPPVPPGLLTILTS